MLKLIIKMSILLNIHTNGNFISILYTLFSLTSKLLLLLKCFGHWPTSVHNVIMTTKYSYKDTAGTTISF